MFKRLIPILFLSFYALSVVGSTIERTQAWVAERSQGSKHGGGQRPARITEWHRRPVRQLWQFRILEDGSVLVSPFASTNPPHFETALQHSSVRFATARSAQVFTSRAPPTSIS
jgi:hypothetical protein